MTRVRHLTRVSTFRGSEKSVHHKMPEIGRTTNPSGGCQTMEWYCFWPRRSLTFHTSAEGLECTRLSCGVASRGDGRRLRVNPDSEPCLDATQNRDLHNCLSTRKIDHGRTKSPAWTRLAAVASLQPPEVKLARVWESSVEGVECTRLAANFWLGSGEGVECTRVRVLSVHCQVLRV